MRTSQNPSADWAEVLSRVETALAQAIVRLDERDKALAAATALPQTPKLLDFSKFDERLAAFAGHPLRVEQQWKKIGATLLGSEEGIRQWLARAETARRQLAKVVGGAVG